MNWHFIEAVEGTPVAEPLKRGQVLLMDVNALVHLSERIPPGKRVRISIDVEE